MKLSAPISTHDSKEGDVFIGTVSEDVVVEGKTVIPAGANMNGRITRLSEPRRFAGRPSIQLTPYWITLSSGKSLQIAAAVVDTNHPRTLHVNDEGRIKGPGINSRDKVEFVAATGTGTVVGSVVSLGTGSWIGAAAGASFATGHWLIRRHSLELPVGTELIMEISNPVAAPTTALTVLKTKAPGKPELFLPIISIALRSQIHVQRQLLFGSHLDIERSFQRKRIDR
jgi:hypothetical protein